MVMQERVYQSDGQTLFAITEHPENRVLIADSWLVKNGFVIALEWHRERFFKSCFLQYGIESTVLMPLWKQVCQLIPNRGLWFPRIEMAGTVNAPIFQLRVRVAPPIKESIRLMVCDIKDRRKAPRHKGPDMAWLSKLRHQVLEKGGDEGILTTNQGYLLEGLTTSFLWWEKQGNQDILYAVPDSNRILLGTMRRLILTIAHQKGIPIAYRLVHLKQLEGREVWAVNALHGIRPVIDWDQSPFSPKENALTHERLAHWRMMVNQYAQPIS